MWLHVRLPSTSFPIDIKTFKGISSVALLELLVREYNLQDPGERTLVIGPTLEDPGRILKKTDLIVGTNREVVDLRQKS